MGLQADDLADVERPRMRRLVAVIAVVVPIIVLAGAAAAFIRAYIMPPTVAVSETAVTSTADAMPTTALGYAPVASPQTTGAAPPPAASSWPLATRAASVWDSVPLPGPPRNLQALSTTSAVAAGEPAAAPVPLPPQRPRISPADFDLPAVPL